MPRQRKLALSPKIWLARDGCWPVRGSMAKTVKARLVAKGYQDPDPRGGNVDIAGCVSRRSAHLQLRSLGALKK